MKKDKLVLYINIFSCLYIVAWVMLPIFRNITDYSVLNYLIIFISILWFITSIFISRSWLYEVLGVSILGGTTLIIIGLYYITEYGDMNIGQFLSLYFIFLFIYMGYFYFIKASRTVIKIIFMFVILCFIITALTTSYNLILDLNVARTLTSSSTSENVVNNLEMRNIGDFGFIYGTLIIIPMLVLLIKKSISKKKIILSLISIIVLILGLTVIIFSNFTIAYLLLILALVLSLLTTFKNIYLVISSVTLFVFLLFPLIERLLIQLLSFIVNITPSIMTQNKLVSIVNTLEGSSNIENVSVRSTLLENSLNSFLSHPFIGVGAYYHNHNVVGNHSQFLDNFARFGIIGFLPLLIFMLVILFKTNKKIINKKIKNTHFYCSFLFVILGLLNPVHVAGILFMVYFTLPIFSRYLQDEGKNSRREIEL